MKISGEQILVALFFCVLLYLGPGSYLNHELSHDFPYGYGASDAFQHQVRAEAIKDAGNFRYEAAYISSSLEGVVGRYPPVLYHLGVLLSSAAGIQVYDGIYFLILFFSVLGIAGFYCLLREYNKTIALLALPLTILIFSFPASIGLYWGHWPSILGQVFLMGFVWAVSKSSLKGSWALIAMALSSVMLAHTSEAIFGMIFLGMFLAAQALAKSLSFEKLKNVVIGLCASALVSSYYLIIFMNTWAKAQPYRFSIEALWQGNPGFYLTGFGFLLLPVTIGMLIGLLKAKEAPVAAIAGFAFLLSGFMNYIGFGF